MLYMILGLAVRAVRTYMKFTPLNIKCSQRCGLPRREYSILEGAGF